jgi:TonB dependent receptor
MRRWLRICAIGLLICVLLATSLYSQTRITIRLVDENGVAVPDALVAIQPGSGSAVSLRTDYLGRCHFTTSSPPPYSVHAEKPGFYVLNLSGVDLAEDSQYVLAHQQQIQQEVNVVGSTPAIDPAQTSDASRMQTPEIVNVPYPTSRDVRNLLPFNPGVVPDPAGIQVHVAGSETWQTRNLLDGFNITSPVSGTLSMRFSPDAIRSVEVESTRYPAEFGNTSGGIIAFRTGMGDNRFRFNATNFIPSFQNKKGLTFDKFVPRFTFSGPLKRDRAWFYDGMELEYDNVVVPELPAGMDSNRPWRGSNLTRFQVNVTPANILTVGGLVNLLHSQFDGISPRNPQGSTARREITSAFAYILDQQTFRDGTVLEAGVAGISFDDALSPHGTGPYVITPEGTQGSFFETTDGTSHRVEEKVDLYISPQHWVGRHVLKIGADLNEIQYGQNATFRPINYLREDGTLLRQSTFPNAVDISGNNFEGGAYVEDAYSPSEHWLVEPGARFDWDRITGHGVVSPRLALTYAFGRESMTKISAGIGLYYDHTQLDLLERTQQSPRVDTMFAANGVTPVGAPIATVFTYQPNSLQMPETLNWSVGVERQLPKQIILRTNFIEKRGYDQFIFQNAAQPGRSIYALSNSRHDHYKSLEVTASRSFKHGYSLFGSYVRSSATTDAVLNYSPTLSVLGPQGGGPLPWDTPNRLISWGWLPFPKTKRMDFVFAVDWRTGYPFTSVTANQDVVGAPNSRRFPDYFSFNPGLEIRFHLRKTYFGLRAVAENITARENPYSVNNVVDSPGYLSFTGRQGRALTARIRIIGSN